MHNKSKSLPKYKPSNKKFINKLLQKKKSSQRLHFPLKGQLQQLKQQPRGKKHFIKQYSQGKIRQALIFEDNYRLNTQPSQLYHLSNNKNNKNINLREDSLTKLQSEFYRKINPEANNRKRQKTQGLHSYLPKLPIYHRQQQSYSKIFGLYGQQNQIKNKNIRNIINNPTYLSSIILI